ncbi:hypothetical protein DTL42_14085 [Bremerella cremea]|uniref:Uncharacterized protein n=1 Tax=Bremerella cremea TaxID=1031537 RepID=A0A368KRX7_9BACT|nr:hypothetical protein [Bremerella cremea]RCS47647.1 hypothetical protein DTL42_14085 [Bremerella cremea]
MPARRRELKPDTKGRYRPYLGFRLDADGNRKEHRFNLGTNRREAERRVDRLYDLHDESEIVAGETIWTPFALYAAKLIEKGTFTIPYPFHEHLLREEDPTAQYAQMLHVEQQNHPSLHIVPAEPDLYAHGLKVNGLAVGEELKELEEAARLLGVITSRQVMPDQLVTGTLHEALDVFGQEVVHKNNVRAGTDGELTQYGRLRMERIGRFKERHSDIPLSALHLDSCTDLVRYWANRPPTKNRRTGGLDGKPIARKTAEHHIKELFSFLNWLDATSRFSWIKPRGLAQISRKIAELDVEKANKLKAVQKDTYTLEELAVLNRHATPLERLLLYVALNCGMGAAELGRLRSDDFLLDHEHEHALRLGFTSTETDSFIRFLRPKTGVFGEWLLWPETIVMVRWGFARSRRFGSELLFVSEKGDPWYKEQAKRNPQAKFTNVFTALIRRIQKSEPSFRKLAFGTLRDTLPNMLRLSHSSEMASICLAHGSTFKGDELIDCYTNKPFGRFHDLMREARRMVEVVFAAVDGDPTEAPTQQYIPLKVREQMRAMLKERRPTGEIAKTCGVCRATVCRERQRMDSN